MIQTDSAMKYLGVLVLAAMALAGSLSCSKEKNPSGSNPSGTDKVEIQSIEMPSSMSMDVDWDPVTLVVGLTPSNASLDDVEAKVKDGSVISLERVQTGFRISPRKVGQTTVTVRALSGPAASKTCTVVVTEAGMSGTVEVSSIKLGENDIQLADLAPNGEAEYALIPLALSPSNVTVADLQCSSDDGSVHAELVPGDPAALMVTIPSNTSHAATSVRTAKVRVRAKNGPASDAVLSVSIRGHVYGLELGASAEHMENGEIHFTENEAVTLKPEIAATGALKNGADKIQYTYPASDISIDGNVLRYVKSGKITGAKDFLSLKAECGCAPAADMKVHTYTVPSDISFDDHMDEGAAFKVGGSYILSVKVLPENARQKLTYSQSGTAMAITDFVEVSTGAKLDLRAENSTKDQQSITFKAANLSRTWYYVIDDYAAGDVKPGDFVYYSPSAGFTRSDGGLRAISYTGGWKRMTKNSVAPTSYTSLIGVVYEAGADAEAGISDIKLCGLKDGYGKAVHAKVLSLKDSGNKWVYSTSAPQFDSKWDKSKYGPAPVGQNNSNSYNLFRGLQAYNAAVGASYRVKAIYSTETYNSEEHPVKIGTSSVAGSTGWLVPSYVEAVFILDRKDIWSNAFSIIKGSAGASYVDDYDGPYWTSCIDPSNQKNAYTSKKSSVNRESTLGTRPILVL